MRLIACVREKFGERFLDPLRARAGKANRGIFAFRVRANGWHGATMAADVAAELLFLPVKREREAAIRALNDFPHFGHCSEVE